MNKYREALYITVAAMMALSSGFMEASVINDSNAVETLGVSVRGLKICHQHEWRNLTVELEYETDIHSTSADIHDVKSYIRAFLEEYSSPDDFWEVMNTKLVGSLSEAFPDMAAMKSVLSLAPDRTLSFPRQSIVRYERDTQYLKETFSFTKLNYLICQETFRALNLHISWEMKENPNPAVAYPDYQWVDSAMNTFFKDHPLSFSNWKIIKHQLQDYLLERFPTLLTIDVEISVVE